MYSSVSPIPLSNQAWENRGFLENRGFPMILVRQKSVAVFGVLYVSKIRSSRPSHRNVGVTQMWIRWWRQNESLNLYVLSPADHALSLKNYHKEGTGDAADQYWVLLDEVWEWAKNKLNRGWQKGLSKSGWTRHSHFIYSPIMHCVCLGALYFNKHLQPGVKTETEVAKFKIEKFDGWI
jgi:hypothetical protein